MVEKSRQIKDLRFMIRELGFKNETKFKIQDLKLKI